MSLEILRRVGFIEKTLGGIFSKKRVRQTAEAKPVATIPTVSGYISLDTRTPIDIGNIMEFAYPVVEFIRARQPDYVVVNSRTARLFGLSVLMLYQNLYQSFPTRDHSISFANISAFSHIPLEETAEYLRPHIEKMTQAVDQPRVLILDDRVREERRDFLQKVVGGLSSGRIQLLFGAMQGKGYDVCGQPESEGVQRWRDSILVNGVRHDGTDILKVRSKLANEYRTDLSLLTTIFARTLKEKGLVQNH